MPSVDPAPLHGWQAWLFQPLDAGAWRMLRRATGLLIAWWLLSFGGRHAEFFGPAGWLDDPALRASVAVARGPDEATRELNAGLPDPAGEGIRVLAPRWSPMYLMRSPWMVHALFAATLLAAGLLVADRFPRGAAVVAWLGACGFATQPATATSGAESFALLAAFCTMLGTLLESRAGGGSGPRFALRLWQLHAAAWIVAAGLAKAQAGDWWQGTALWQASQRADAWTPDRLQALRSAPAGFAWELAGWSLLARALIVWQVWFPAFAWTNRGRWAVLAGGLLGCVGCFAVFGDPLFGPAWLVCCLAFLREGDWRRLTRRA